MDDRETLTIRYDQVRVGDRIQRRGEWSSRPDSWREVIRTASNYVATHLKMVHLVYLEQGTERIQSSFSDDPINVQRER